MKTFKENSAGKIPAIIVFIVFGVVILLMLFSCSTLGQVQIHEDLCEPNLNDRIIVGYSKNMKWYKVTDQKDRPREDVRIDSIVRPIGGILISKHRGVFYCRY